MQKRCFVQASLGDRAQLLLPLGGQRRGLDFVRDQLQQLFSFCRDENVLAPFFQQKAVKQFLDDVGTGGNGAEPACFADRFDQLLAFIGHVFGRVLHRGQQACFRKRLRRFRFALCEGNLVDAQTVPFRHLRQCLIRYIALLFLHVMVVHLFPALRQDRFPPGKEKLAPHSRLDRGLLIGKRRVQHSQETLHH